MKLSLRQKKTDTRVSSLRTAAIAARACATLGCAPVGPDFVRPEVELSPDWLEAEQKQMSYGLRLNNTEIAPGNGEAHRAKCLGALALWRT